MSLKKPVTPPGIDPGTVRLVAQLLNHYATAGPKVRLYRTVIKSVLCYGKCNVYLKTSSRAVVKYV